MKRPTVNGRRKFLYSLGALSLGGLALAYRRLGQYGANAKGKLVAKAKPRLGINISGVAYWGSEYPFVNLMYQSGEWISQPASGEWGEGPELSLDKHGWIKQLAAGCRATKILCAGEDGNLYPSGRYVILYDGEGEILPHKITSSVTKNTAGRMEVDVDATKGMFAIDVVSTNPKNYIRNIRVIMPGFEASYIQNPWHPDFLARWSGVACIRMMDLMVINNATQVVWEDRPHIENASYAEKGVPAELLIDLANRLKTDVWFCMPHMADDSYIRQFATLAKDKLQHTLRAWVEYSNEVWNGGFSQFTYAAEQGRALNLSNEDWEAAFQYNAHRSAQIFSIWARVFNDEQRIVKVIASQAANAWLSEQLLKVPALAEQADVLAIAPYISMNVPESKDEEGLSSTEVSNWTLNQLFDYLNTNKLSESKRWIQANKKIADVYGLKLVAYEAGQHLVGVQGGENHEQLTKFFKQANADKRMGDIYQRHLIDWEMAGGDLWCAFNSMGGWSKWGSWGLLEYADKPTAKYRVTIKWAKSKGQQMRVIE